MYCVDGGAVGRAPCARERIGMQSVKVSARHKALSARRVCRVGIWVSIRAELANTVLAKVGARLAQLSSGESGRHLMLRCRELTFAGPGKYSSSRLNERMG